jgi:hypothetical protein
MHDAALVAARAPAASMRADTFSGPISEGDEGVADLLDTIQAEIRDRLKELRPAVTEVEQLEAALAALGASEAAASNVSRSGNGGRPTSKRAPRGQNKARIYAAIEAKPEATVSDIHDATGIAKPLIYNTTRSGLEKGDLARVSLAGGHQGFKLKSPESVKPPKPRSRSKQSGRKSKGRTSAPEAATASAEAPDTFEAGSQTT